MKIKKIQSLSINKKTILKTNENNSKYLNIETESTQVSDFYPVLNTDISQFNFNTEISNNDTKDIMKKYFFNNCYKKINFDTGKKSSLQRIDKIKKKIQFKIKNNNNNIIETVGKNNTISCVTPHLIQPELENNIYKEELKDKINDDSYLFNLKSKIKTFYKNKNNNHNYYGKISNTSDNFYNSAENRINFRFDILTVPKIKNNLNSQIFNKSKYSLKEKLNNLIQPNLLDDEVNLCLSELRRKCQFELDEFKMNKSTPQNLKSHLTIEEKIENKFNQFENEVESNFNKVEESVKFANYLSCKINNYEKVNLADKNMSDIVLKIPYNHREITKRFSKSVLRNKIIERGDKMNYVNLLGVMEGHTKCIHLHKNQKIVDTNRNKINKNSFTKIKKPKIENNVQSYERMKNILKILNNE